LDTHRVDVLVVGFGAAGAAAALDAHRRGASVQIVEKCEAGGGNCRHSGGFLFDIAGPSAIDHLDALCFGKTDRSVLRTYAEGVRQVPMWLREMGGRVDPVDMDAFGGMLPSWPYLPGAGHVTYRQFVGDGARPGIALWELLERSVAAAGIPVSTHAPVTELLMREGAVRGAVVQGREIEADGGVILACGGMEYDAEMRDTYLALPLVPVGHPGNTGDSLRLAAQAGASLWHMSAFFGWTAHRRPDHEAAFTLDVHAPSFLYVDADGRRFADETGWEVHDKIRSWTAFFPRNRNRPHLPGYIVFDEAARRAGPLNGIVGTPNDYVWSGDNSAEVASGWITRADTPNELAQRIGVAPETLTATLDAYAGAVAVGRDEQFGRSADTLAALEAPLYAIEMCPGLATASGGPRRDARARVLAPGDTPIAGLYAAGAAGSIWGHLTEHGGGLTDAIVFGRVAGNEAAARARG
jgi:succinate dehydrogenase/fumarate reductase flavoprotein subunit